MTRVFANVFCGVLLLLAMAAARSQATPIKPDVNKVLARPQVSATDFAPARAGWDGPEISSARPAGNTTLENIGPAASARAARSALLAAAIPDPRAVAAIVLLILLLRRIRQTRERARGQPLPAAAVAIREDDPPIGIKPAA